tara:strand:- start:5485 stop:5643 length:159 start_codon:yes stop_codon:yes gene_type:complete
MNKSIDKTKHTYIKDINLELEYTYDEKSNIVYDLKKLRRHFRNIVNTLKDER